jgi:plasmid maintenance system antidote protein VapI
MAVRLSKAVGNDPDFWLRLQRQYDVAQVLKEAKRIEVVPFSKLAREKAREAARAA